ncbi:MAG TPA: peptide chain release factor N(5)-glutamine methyltransferase [Vicinamibacteria bacterium]|nr:peptide chain release factor N(5)-glutamine methyltransferase [Vicinamibacteria bacterium]
MNVAQALERAASHLKDAGIESARPDAELLLRHVLGWDRATLYAEAGALVPPSEEGAFFSLVQKRAERRPLQHLTGRQAFWGREFLVGPDVLIPRPETEILVEAALGWLRGVGNPLVVDVGTGSGCIALSLAAERPDAEVHATDISGPALAVARENARRLGLAERVRFHEGDLLQPVPQLEGRLHLVASNPPYVDPLEAPRLAPEVRDHEPAVALFPGADAYALYRRLAPASARMLRRGGSLLLEIGQGMESEVVRLLAEAGLRVARVIPDLAGIPRTIVAERA